MRHIVILGAGTAGTIMANRLTRLLSSDVEAGDIDITIVDRDDQHVYQPGLLFVPFRLYTPEEIVRPRWQSLPAHVRFERGDVERIAADKATVHLTDGRTLPYDVLVLATGARTLPEETEGLTGAGWRESAFDFFTLEGATALATALGKFTAGRLVVNVVDMPIKCPVAPLEFAFLADWYYTMRGIRDQVHITYATPLDGAFTKPIAADRLAHLLSDKHIELVTEFNAGAVDGKAGTLSSWDDRTIDFDLLVTIPLHGGAPYVARTPGLGDDNGFVLTDKHTLQATLAPNIFAIGDAANLPTSKAGSVAHFESEVLAPNIVRYLRGEPLRPDFDGHANCFIETGFNKALLIDFNYDTEPLPGHFPFGASPLPLLKESYLAHQGKMLFRWMYWNLILPGHALPGVSARMSLAGKYRPAPAPQPA